MKEIKKNKKMTIEDLAVITAKGFESVDKRFDVLEKDVNGLKKDVTELKTDMGEVKENVKYIKRDILNLGDRFVSYHAFDSLASRVKILEEKKK